MHYLRSPRTCPIRFPEGTSYGWCACGQLKTGTPDELDRWWMRHCSKIDLSTLESGLAALRGRAPRRERWAHSTRELSVLAHAWLVLREPVRWHPTRTVREWCGLVKRVVLVSVDVLPCALTAPTERVAHKPTLDGDRWGAATPIPVVRRWRDGTWGWLDVETGQWYRSLAVAGAASITASAAGGSWNTNGAWVGGVQPTAADDVLLTVASGNVVVTAGSLCRSLNEAGYAGTLSGSGDLSIGDGSGGACTLGGTISGTWTTAFKSTSNNGGTGWSITSNGKTFPGSISFNGSGGKWVQADALSTGSNVAACVQGTWATGNFGVTCLRINRTAGGTFTLTPGSSTFTCSGNGINITAPNGTGFTVTANTAVVNVTAASQGVLLNGVDFNGLTLNVSGGGACSIDNGTLGALSITGTAVKSDTFALTGNVTVTGTFTANGNSSTNRLLVLSNTVGTARTITAATTAVTNCDFKDITGAGAASWNLSAVTGGSGDCGGNSNITFTTAITTVRGGVNVNGSYLRTNAVSACYVSVPDSAALSVVNDIDVRARASISSWSIAGQQDFVTKWGSSGQLSYALTIASGTLSFVISTTGSNAVSVSSSTTVGFGANTTGWVRATRVKTTGVVTFYTSSVTNPTGPSDWTQLGTTQTSSANSAMFDSTAPVEVGSQTLATLGLFTGNFYRAQIRNNVLDDGTGIQLDADFTAVTAAAASFVESSSNAATVSLTNVESSTWSALRWSAAAPPLPQDTVRVGAAIQTGTGLTVDMPRIGKDVSFAGHTRTVAFSSVANEMYGSLTLGSGMTTSGTNTLTLAGRGAQTLTSAAITTTFPITVSAPGGTYTQQDDLSCGLTLTLTAGTLAANNFNSTFVVFVSTGALTRVVNMGTGTWQSTRTGAADIWTVSGSNLTINASTSTIKVRDASTSTRTFTGGGFTYGSLTYTVAGSTGILSIAGSNTWGGNWNLSDATNARAITIANGTVQTFTSTGSFFNVTGSSGKNTTFASTSAGNAYTLTKTGSAAVFVDFVTVTDSTATGGLWVDGTHYTNGGGNTGWTFADNVLTGADTGTGTDTAVSIAFTSTEAGTGTDDASLAVAATGPDTGSDVEAGTLAAAATGTDSGAGTDDAASDAALTSADTGSGVDAATVGAALADSDTGAGAEAGTLAAALSGADTGTSSEDGTTAAALATTDTGTGADTGSLAAQVTDTDTGAGVEAGALAATIMSDETGAGADDEGSLVAALTNAETATGVDVEAVAAILAGSDTGTSVDDGTLAAAVPGSDTSTGTETSTIAAAIPGSETSAGADDATLAALAASGELAAGAETGTLAASLANAEAGTSADDGTLAAALSSSETGTGADAELVTVSLTEDDSGTDDEFWSIVAALTDVDTGSGVDDSTITKPSNVVVSFGLELAVVEFDPAANGVTFAVDDGGVAFATVTSDLDATLAVAGTTFGIEVE